MARLLKFPQGIPLERTALLGGLTPARNQKKSKQKIAPFILECRKPKQSVWPSWFRMLMHTLPFKVSHQLCQTLTTTSSAYLQPPILVLTLSDSHLRFQPLNRTNGYIFTSPWPPMVEIRLRLVHSYEDVPSMESKQEESLLKVARETSSTFSYQVAVAQKAFWCINTTSILRGKTVLLIMAQIIYLNSCKFNPI